MLKRSRIIIMSVIVYSIIICYVFQLMQYQVVQGDSFKTQASQSTVGKMDIIAPRGEILDRYGRVLATSNIGYSIIVERLYFPSSKQLKQQNDELLTLADIVVKSGGQVEDSLPISETAPYTYNANSKRDVKTLIKNINGNLTKNIKTLTANASADEAMKALKIIYKTSGYNESQQRMLCGIRYEMLVKDYTYLNNYTFATNINIDTVTKIEENSTSLPGVVIQQIPQRTYPDGLAAPNVIGLTGPISAEKLARYKSQGYSADDIVGITGIENQMEKYLHGENGSQQVEVNSNGNVASSTVLTQPKPGANVVLTIDKSLQEDLQNMLPTMVQGIRDYARSTGTPGADAQGAAAVVLNVKTGEVLAMADYPTYDLNLYRKNFSQLVKDPLNPLYDRSLKGAYRPGSTFKPIVAVSGLMNGTITKDTTWSLPATYTIGSGSTAWTGKDDNGLARTVNVEGAIQKSSNVFFYTLGTMLGINKIDTTAYAFGLGKKTGIELPGESAGVMSSPAEKNAYGLPWYPADTAQASIGQLDTLITPLQLANYVSTLVKGGTQYQVHVVRQVNNYDNTKVIINNTKPSIKSKYSIPDSVIQTVKEGMGQVTQEGGTAESVFGGFAMRVGGKTGTAQVGQNGGYNGVFICFAPYDDPEVAIATVVEYGHNGYQTAPAAKEAIVKYFGLDSNGNKTSSTVSSTQVGKLLQ